ncbi:MAG: LysR family transcriptional regulator [Bacteroidales bacterium]|nr:LysR family transcriptional regulator [Bacteroidales bacterium]
MELRQIKYFVKSAETENFSLAAQDCFVVQSTLSQQIKQLEEDLGVQLFERIGKRISLTEAGRQFLPFARQMLETAEQGRQQLHDMEGLKTGRLRIGATYGLSVLLTKTMQLFCPQYPDIQFDVQFESADKLTSLLHNREIDFALTYNLLTNDPLLEEVPLFESRLCAVVADGHPLAEIKEVRLSQLKTFLVAIPAKGMNARTIVDGLLRKHAVDLRPLMEINEIYTMIHMVKSCQLVAILPESVIYEEEGYRAIPIREARDNMYASLVYVKGMYQRNAVKEFFKCIRTFVASPYSPLFQ